MAGLGQMHLGTAENLLVEMVMTGQMVPMDRLDHSGLAHQGLVALVCCRLGRLESG